MSLNLIQSVKTLPKDEVLARNFDLLKIDVPDAKVSDCPVDIYFVIDISGSMSSDFKIDMVKATLQFARAKLENTRCQFTMITFGTVANTVIPLTDYKKPKNYASEIDSIVANGGSTNISSALQMAHLKISEKSNTKEGAERIPIVFLLTDGEATDGITYTVEIRNFVAKQQTQATYPIHTFALGSNHAPLYLKAISESSNNGLYHYIDGPHSIPEVFGVCLGGVLSIAAINVKMTIDFHTGGKLEQVLVNILANNSDVNIDTESRKVARFMIKYGALYAGESRRFPMVIAVASVPGFVHRLDDRRDTLNAQYDHKIFSAKLQFNPVCQGVIMPTQSISLTETIVRTDDATMSIPPISHEIEEEVIKFYACRCMEVEVDATINPAYKSAHITVFHDSVLLDFPNIASTSCAECFTLYNRIQTMKTKRPPPTPHELAKAVACASAMSAQRSNGNQDVNINMTSAQSSVQSEANHSVYTPIKPMSMDNFQIKPMSIDHSRVSSNPTIYTTIKSKNVM